MSSLINNANENLLNLSFLTAVFYNFADYSSKNFEKISKNKYNQLNMRNEFDTLNNDNVINYYDNLSLINSNDIKENKNKYKIDIINKIFGKEFFKKENNDMNDEGIILEKLTKKMNISMFSNKNKLIEFISIPIINFLFEIFENFEKIIKNMEARKRKEIQTLNESNLLSEATLNNSIKKLSDENIDLKNKIQLQKETVNGQKRMNKNISQKNKDLEEILVKQRVELKKLQNVINEDKKKFNTYQRELNSSKIESEKKVSFLETQLNELNKKISQTQNELDLSKKESEERISLLQNELSLSKTESEERISVLQNELNLSKTKSKEKISDLQNELSLSKKESTEKMFVLQKKSEENLKLIMEEIEKLKRSNEELNEKVKENIIQKEKAEENYDYMKSLSHKIVYEFLFPDPNYPIEHPPSLTINGLVRMLNVISKDYEVTQNKLKELENEMIEMKKAKKK